jgi:hypothetical protein
MDNFGTYYYPWIVAVVMLLPGAVIGIALAWLWARSNETLL